METRRVREVAVRSQEEVALVMGVSQRTVARLERRAFRKLRAHPEARALLRYIAQQNAQPFTVSVEPTILRKLGTAPGDASFMNISGFAPNL
jgi:transcriptional regulator with XRE-family HTH domain